MPQQGTGPAARKRLPLEERLDLLSLGLPADDAIVDAPLRELMDMPLSKYVAGDTGLLRHLRVVISPIPLTFREAAAGLSRLLDHAPDPNVQREMEGLTVELFRLIEKRR